jgi:hypothetical protein
LSSDYLATGSQTEEGITKLVKNLAAYELTKAEKLQIVNLMPTLPVELYVVSVECRYFANTSECPFLNIQIVEELEDRFGQQIEEILDYIKESLSIPTEGTARTGVVKINGQSAPRILLESPVVVIEAEQWDEDADAIYDEEYFDDNGVGAGVEGDLEMDED